MLGTSSGAYDATIRHVLQLLRPQSVLELGCGQGKFGGLLRETLGEIGNLRAVQKIFTPGDREALRSLGYRDVVDRDILEHFREGFDEHYDLVVALDVIEHFLISDIWSIVHFALYRADYMLLVWPSAHPQSAVTSAFDRHRSSFELSDLASRFDVVFYAQTGFAQVHFQHRYHIALLRGFMNAKVLPPVLAGAA